MQAEADLRTVARLEREVRDHKRASRWHRDQAHEKRARLAAMVAALNRRGIAVTTTTSAKPEGGQSDTTSHQKASPETTPPEAGRR